MKLLIKEKNKYRINNLIEWLLYMAGYTLVFILVTSFFKSIHIDNNHLVLWSVIIVLVTYILNKTIKPVLVTLTIPITGLTLGLFYPFINVFILKLTDWILGKHFELDNIFILFFVAILLSVANFVIEKIIESIIRRLKVQHG